MLSKLLAKAEVKKQDSQDQRDVQQIVVEAIREERMRLAKLHDAAAAVEELKREHNLAGTRVPPQAVSDRLIRYEAHLSREFDRTLNQLERLQRMRNGQPVLPPINVEVSS